MAYLPAKKLPDPFAKKLSEFLKERSIFPQEYMAAIEKEKKLPGSIETNEEDWSSQPWFNTWFNNLSERKSKDPFQGIKKRLQVPLDPDSVRISIHP